MSHFDKLLLTSFPAETAMRRRITQEILLKQYIDAGYGRAAHSAFFKRVKSVYTRRVISPDRVMNLLSSPSVPLLVVMHLSLREGVTSLPDASLQKFDRLFAYCLIHLIDQGDRFMFRMAHKRFTSEGRVLALGDYISSPWLSASQLAGFLPFSGTSMESVYCGCLTAITEGRFRRPPEMSLDDAIARTHQLLKLEKDIADLEKKLAKERQFNRQMELRATWKELCSQLSNLTNHQ